MSSKKNKEAKTDSVKSDNMEFSEPDGTIPDIVIPIAPKKTILPSDPVVKYKLHLYKPNGILRSEIPRGSYAAMSAKYGDIMRAVPSHKFMTMDEIVESYWELDRRLKFNMSRTRIHIDRAVQELVAADLITAKS